MDWRLWMFFVALGVRFRDLAVLLKHSSPEEVEAAAGVGDDVGEAGGVNDDVIGVPEGDAGEILGEDLLDLDVVVAAGGLVGGSAGGLEEGVEVRVGVASAIGSPGREHAGGVGVVEDVGVFVGADPAKEIKLEGTFGDVSVEGAELGGAEGEVDAGVAEFGLHGLGFEAGGFVGGGLHGEAEADAVVVWVEAGGVEELDGAGGAVGVVGERSRGCGGPVAGWKESVGGLGLAAPDGGDESGLVDGEGDGLADARVAKGGVLRVDIEVVDARAGAGGGTEIGLIAEGVDHVHGEEIAFDVCGAFFHLEGGGDGVGDDLEDEVLQGGAGGAGPVGWVAIEDDVFVLHLGDEAEGAGADGMEAFAAVGTGFDDTEEAVG